MQWIFFFLAALGLIRTTIHIDKGAEHEAALMFWLSVLMLLIGAVLHVAQMH